MPRSTTPPRPVGHTCPTINHLQKRARKVGDLEGIRLLEGLRAEVQALRARLVWFEEEVDQARHPCAYCGEQVARYPAGE